jgi:hypothetical protein
LRIPDRADQRATKPVVVAGTVTAAVRFVRGVI